MVSGVCVPSVLSRTIAMCSRSRTILNPSKVRALTTFVFGASTGNLGTKLLLEFRQQTLPAPENQPRTFHFQKSQDGNESLIARRRAPLRSCHLRPQRRL